MNYKTLTLVVLGLFILASCSTDSSTEVNPVTVELEFLSRLEVEAEIPAYDAGSKKVFTVNGSENLGVVDLSDPAAPVSLAAIDLTTLSASAVGGANSVAVHDGVVAVAVENDDKQANGFVFFLDTDGNLLAEVGVGALPDMLTFSADGSQVVVANEGEPSDDYSNDPEGSVSIIDISAGVASASVKTAGFSAFNDSIDADVRVFGPNASVAQDLEPEYIAISPDGSTAFAALQENNALAVVDLAAGSISSVLPLGFKDFSKVPLDPSNEDGGINFATFDNLFGMYQPDAIAAYDVEGTTYIVTANEGDAREYIYEVDTLEDCPVEAEEDEGVFLCPAFIDEERIKDITLDPTVFPNAAALQDEAVLGRLKITNTLGDTDGDGDFDELYSYGARSFSIWNASTGALVFDSADDFEKTIATDFPADFQDGRSDDKGPEPEGVVLMPIAEQVFAVIGMERTNSLFVYDITTPTTPEFVQYVAANDTDVGPEGFSFISEEDNATDSALLLVTSEVSNTLTVYSVNVGESTE